MVKTLITRLSDSKPMSLVKTPIFVVILIIMYFSYNLHSNNKSKILNANSNICGSVGHEDGRYLQIL